ncbi:MAG: DUF1552 domain-containing protein [Myxococcota bacterium]
MPRYRPHTRRGFLRGAAGTAIALPFLASLEEPGRAQPSSQPRRFVAYCQPLGTFGEMFWPHRPGETPYQFPDRYEGDACPGSKCRDKVRRTGETFADYDDWQASRILQPLDRHRSDLIVLEGIDNQTGNHPGYTAMLTGARPIEDEGGASISVDQRMANVVGADTKFASLQLGVETAPRIHTRHTVSWYGPTLGAPAESHPRAVFRRVFGDLATDEGEVNYIHEQRASILDLTLEQARSLDTQLGHDDRIKLEQYLDSVRDVETRLTRLPGAGCSVPMEPDIPDGRKEWQVPQEMIPASAEMQLDLLALALACDLTRVITFQMAFEATNMTHPWLGVDKRWHDLSHNGASKDRWWEDMEQYVRISEWNAELLAGLVDRLKSNGVFDDTAILWTNPMHNGQNHNSRSLPLVVAAGSGMPFRTGRHVRYATGRDDPQRKINDLHVTFLNAMGIEDTSFGDPEANLGPLTELLA